VTAMVSGIDLVREQILIAMGERLSFDRTLEVSGHAIEVRINAEDPLTFAPSPGRITALHLPGGLGVRVDTHVYDQYVVPPFYDSLLAKLIVFADTRGAAISRLRRCLDELVVEGISTNAGLHRRIVDSPEFQSGDFDTHFLAGLGVGSS